MYYYDPPRLINSSADASNKNPVNNFEATHFLMFVNPFQVWIRHGFNPSPLVSLKSLMRIVLDSGLSLVQAACQVKDGRTEFCLGCLTI
jgi:hypothetical protein